MKEMEHDQFDEFLSKGEKTLVLFYADWCLYCQKFKPFFESLQGNFSIIGAKVNEDENPL